MIIGSLISADQAGVVNSLVRSVSKPACFINSGDLLDPKSDPVANLVSHDQKIIIRGGGSAMRRRTLLPGDK